MKVPSATLCARLTSLLLLLAVFAVPFLPTAGGKHCSGGPSGRPTSMVEYEARNYSEWYAVALHAGRAPAATASGEKRGWNSDHVPQRRALDAAAAGARVGEVVRSIALRPPPQAPGRRQAGALARTTFLQTQNRTSSLYPTAIGFLKELPSVYASNKTTTPPWWGNDTTAYVSATAPQRVPVAAGGDASRCAPRRQPCLTARRPAAAPADTLGAYLACS